MAKLKTVEHRKASKSHNLRRKPLNQSQFKMRNRGRQSNSSALRSSRKLLNNSVNYISKNKLYTFLAVGLITAGSIYLARRRENSNLSFLNRMWNRF